MIKEAINDDPYRYRGNFKNQIRTNTEDNIKIKKIS